MEIRRGAISIETLEVRDFIRWETMDLHQRLAEIELALVVLDGIGVPTTPEQVAAFEREIKHIEFELGEREKL